jgi:putative FmdB family regulatory protein
MPTYQYRCAKCGEQFDAWQSIHDDRLVTHDGGCGGELSKVLGVGGIVLKGSGFYRTDSRTAARGRDGKAREDGSGKESTGAKADAASSNGARTDGKEGKEKAATPKSSRPDAAAKPSKPER